MARTMDYVERFERLFKDLQSWPLIEVIKADVAAAQDSLDNAAIEDILADGGFLPDQGMLEFWSQVQAVKLSWKSLHAASPSRDVEGFINIKSIFDTCFTGYHTGIIDQMAPDTEKEREHLLALRHLELRDALHWVAIRPDDDDAPRLWIRFPCSRTGVDVPLVIDFAEYVEKLFSLRGVLNWPLLFVEAEAVPERGCRGLLDHELPSVAEGLELLAKMPGAQADAQRHLALLAEIRKTLAK